MGSGSPSFRAVWVSILAAVAATFLVWASRGPRDSGLAPLQGRPPGSAIGPADREAGVVAAAGRGASEALARLPLAFEPNVGQACSEARFVARGGGYRISIVPAGALLDLLSLERSCRLRMSLIGASPSASMEGLDELRGKRNYFLGNDPASWRTGVPTYGRVACRNVYPGVDVVFYGNRGRLEYDLVVAPGADPGAIRLSFEGAEQLEVAGSGDLRIRTACGELTQKAPRIYQRGGPDEVRGRYVLRRGGGEVALEVGFELFAYDPRRPLVIDPILVYASYLGGALDDAGTGIAVDALGYVYVTGRTDSLTGFPVTPGAYQTIHGDHGSPPGPNEKDAFVAKLDLSAAGAESLVYCTYLGGDNADEGWSIAVNGEGEAFVTGFTYSRNFPTRSAHQWDLRGSGDAFVAKLGDGGSTLEYSTFLGGNGHDFGFGIAIDPSGFVYVQGRTASDDFVTSTAATGYQMYSAGPPDAFVAKLQPGAGLDYATYLGGSGADEAITGIAVDGLGNVFVTGRTASQDFPTTGGALQGTPGGGYDGFVAKLGATGQALFYSTYFGGSGDDAITGIVVDAPGNAFVAGSTYSSDLGTTEGACQKLDPDYSQITPFVAKLGRTGSSLGYATYLGGTGRGLAYDIAIDSLGNAYVVGETEASNFPTAGLPLQASNRGGLDGFLAKLDPSGQSLLFSTYLGGSEDDGGSTGTSTVDMGVALDPWGAVYVLANTESTDISVTAAPFDDSWNGYSDLYVARICIDDDAPPVVTCPDPITLPAGADGLAAVPDVTGAATATDLCTPSGGFLMTQDPASGTLLGLGVHTISVTATDASGNSGTCSTGFIVIDITAPTLACPPVPPAYADAQGLALVPDVTSTAAVSDNCTPEEQIVLLQSPAAGAAVGVGNHKITVTATDGSGNIASFEVTFAVIDDTPPVIADLPPHTTITAGALRWVAAPDLRQGVVASDNVTPPGALTVIQCPAPGTPLGLGVFTITFTVTDEAGNFANGSITLTVIPGPAPSIRGSGCAAGGTGADPWALVAAAVAIAFRARSRRRFFG